MAQTRRGGGDSSAATWPPLTRLKRERIPARSSAFDPPSRALFDATRTRVSSAARARGRGRGRSDALGAAAHRRRAGDA